MRASSRIKRAAIPRAGYDYQDLAGIEILIQHYRDPDLYDWVMLEADDSEYRALDDVIAARKDGTLELVQVKFTVDPARYEIDWTWLLEKSNKGTSLLAKWAASLVRIQAMGRVHSASLKTNRIPSVSFLKCLKGTRVDFDLVPEDLRDSIAAECGGAGAAEAFFKTFEFHSGTLDLIELESSLRDQLVPADTDLLGWLLLQNCVRRWATLKNQPEPEGRIYRGHVLQIITKKRPQPIRQDFVVPQGYVPPSEQFDVAFRKRIADDATPITILWGTPGRGKSTYLSFLTGDLQNNGGAITRHHYFLASEDAATNRTSFFEISTSLIEQLLVRHPDAMKGASDGPENLRATMGRAAENLAGIGQRLHIVVDGLDHVWREAGHVQQLDHLFNELLPLPPNVSLIIGTQKVADHQLPRRLLTTAKDSDWIEIPRMDEVAVHHWVMEQDKDRPLILRFDPGPECRSETMDKIATAFFNISQGHPLHLIYVYQSLIYAGAPTSPDEIEQLPPCPAGDIRDYYQGLWVRLGTSAKDALHMLAGSDFFWPGIGVRQVLGEYSEIEFLLEPKRIGLVPFHPSIFAWVRERQDHAESYAGLLPRTIDWLAHNAPEYWRWGWLWLARAEGGAYADLLAGATRDWVVESLVSGWPLQQIENILGVAEKKTFEDGDYPRTVAIRSLKTRVSNAKRFQSRDFAAFRAIALAIAHNHQQTLNMLDEIHALDDDEVLELARKGPVKASGDTVPACFAELARRVNTWITLRHRPEREFTKLSDQLLSLASLMDVDTVRRALAYARGFRHPEPHVTRLIRLLEDAQNIEGLNFIRKTLRGTKWAAQRRMIDDGLIRVGSFLGADVNTLVCADCESISLYAACWFLWRNRTAHSGVYIPAIPSDLIRERYSLTGNDDVEEFYINSFWAVLRTGLMAAENPFDVVHPGLDGGDPGWLSIGLDKLSNIACDIAQGRLVPSFSSVFSASSELQPIQFGPSLEREHAQYRAFRNALSKIAVDLHLLTVTDSARTTVPSTEIGLARKSPHWCDERWIRHNVEHRWVLLDREGAADLVNTEARRLLSTVTEFSERSEQWTMLADMARLYGLDCAPEFLSHAAECLVGYGWRKDLHAMEVLEAMLDVGEHNPAATVDRLETLAPIVDHITDFTDGDETNHVRSEFIEVVAKLAPTRLPCLYEHHLSADEYSYADECLVQFSKLVDLNTPEGAALARTFLDDQTLKILEGRAQREPAAQDILTTQNAFLGRKLREHKGLDVAEEQLLESDGEMEAVDPTSFGPGEFSKLVHAAAPIRYLSRAEFMRSWIQYWKNQGLGMEALASIDAYMETCENALGVDEILDEAFLVSLALEGKDAAYSWLVQAHIHRHGWQTNWTSEEEVMDRLQLAARYYPNRWQDYIRDTSLPAPYYRRRGGGFVVGYKYLVRFLVLVGQTQIADNIVKSFIETLVEEVREQPIPEATWFQ